MKTILALILGLLIATAAQAADPLTEALQKGLVEEEANQNLDAAIKAYQDVLARAEEQRRVAATALFRLAECYRKQGKTNEATTEYRRLLRDYGDQSTLVNLSRQNLTGLGAAATVASTTTAQPGDTLTTDEEQQEIQRIRNLIKNSPDLINAKNRWFSPIGSSGVTGTVLHEAAFKGHLLVAEYLLANGANVNAMDNRNQTPLYHAARSGHKRVVELLLSKDAQPSLGDYLPLHAVAERGFIGVAEVLLAAKADVNAERQGRTALHVAIEHKNVQIAELLVANGANVNAMYSRSWNQGPAAVNSLGIADGTPLHLAVQSGNPALVRLLLSKGANVNLSTTPGGLTPIHYVANPDLPADAATAVAEALLQSGASLNATAPEASLLPGWAALHMAVFHKVPHVLRLLLEKGADPNLQLPPQSGNEATALNMAISGGVMEIVELLLKHKADTSARDHNGDTPLVRAIRGQNRPIAELLLSKGADPNALDANGFPPLHVALGVQPMAPSTQPARARGSFAERLAQVKQEAVVQNQRVGVRAPAGESSQQQSILELLLKHKADPTLRDKQTQTALHVAAERRNQAAVELLLEYKADPNARTDFGITPLHRAVPTGDEAVVDLLLAHEADAAAAMKDGGTALHAAAALSLTNIMTKLVRSGADINACGRNNETPLHRAVEQLNNTATVQLLLKLGADIIRSCDGSPTPLERAMIRQDRDSANLLREHYPKKLAVATFQGEVLRPAWSWEADKPVTLSEAIHAIGLKDTADLTRVGVGRGSAGGFYNLAAIREKKAEDVPLKHGDRIHVPARED
jgi:cytohesin